MKTFQIFVEESVPTKLIPENHNEFRQQLIEKTKKLLDAIVKHITKNSLV
jgi:hypothetical protein